MINSILKMRKLRLSERLAQITKLVSGRTEFKPKLFVSRLMVLINHDSM